MNQVSIAYREMVSRVNKRQIIYLIITTAKKNMNESFLPPNYC